MESIFRKKNNEANCVFSWIPSQNDGGGGGDLSLPPGGDRYDLIVSIYSTLTLIQLSDFD